MSSSQSDERLHHTGFVVASIAAVLEGFCRALGGTDWSQIWHDPLQDVRVAFIYASHPGDPSVELVEPAGPDSPVGKFLARGGGLHHLCYEVGNLEDVLQGASARGLIMIRRPQPAVAFGGRRISWFLTHEGLLIEYLERV
ncbi:MAG: VOC family protein [Candidatus Acidiferrales bacterium]